MLKVSDKDVVMMCDVTGSVQHICIVCMVSCFWAAQWENKSRRPDFIYNIALYCQNGMLIRCLRTYRRTTCLHSPQTTCMAGIPMRGGKWGLNTGPHAHFLDPIFGNILHLWPIPEMNTIYRLKNPRFWVDCWPWTKFMHCMIITIVTYIHTLITYIH